MDPVEYLDFNIEKLLPIGQKLNLKRSSLDDSEFYTSYVKDITEGFVFIDLPSKGGINVAIQPKQEVELYIITKDGVWVGKTQIYKVEKSAKLVGAWVHIPEYIEKIQRREYLRLNIMFPVTLQTKDEDGNDITIESKCINISGGGIALSSKKSLSRISNIIEFSYKGINIKTNLKFIHVQFDPIDKIYITGFEFIGLDTKQRENLHKLVISSQIQMRREGLL